MTNISKMVRCDVGLKGGEIGNGISIATMTFALGVPLPLRM